MDARTAADAAPCRACWLRRSVPDVARELSESDGPEVVWAEAHGDDLVGMAEEEAVAIVTAAGFRAVVFRPAAGGALAAMQVRSTITLLTDEGVVRRVRT